MSYLIEKEWSEATVGDVDLGDSRRTARAVQMLARMAENPGGKLSDVFKSAKERDAAYDFMESCRTRTCALAEAFARSTARASAALDRVIVPVDGTSTSLTDNTGKKGFGRIGADVCRGVGLKVINVIAVSADGVPVGLLDQEWWSRPKAPPRSKKAKRHARGKKAPAEKEIHHWCKAIERSAFHLTEQRALGWFQIDREGDAWPVLLQLAEAAEKGHWFTVRAAWNRVTQATGRDKQYLRERMAKAKKLGTYSLEVAPGPGRSARTARMVAHAAEVTLRLRNKATGKITPLPLRAVWVHEKGTIPRGERGLDWLLLTNAPVDTFEQVRDIIKAYGMRWRIEEFHRTWKSGACNVEDTQLRSREAVIRWASMLAVVAVRIERLKRLSREEPTRSAADELSDIEIEVLLLLKRREKKKTEQVPDAIPTLEQAVRWLADLGGYTGKSSGGPPGSITIQRGYDRVAISVQAILAWKDRDK